MPIVYRLETTTGAGPFHSGAVEAVGQEVLGVSSALYDSMTPGRYVPGFHHTNEDLHFGFKTIRQYERWTRDQEVRDAFAKWKSLSGNQLRFAVYQVPKIVGSTNDQAVFEMSKAKLVEERSPAAPRKRTTKHQERIAA